VHRRAAIVADVTGAAFAAGEARAFLAGVALCVTWATLLYVERKFYRIPTRATAACRAGDIN
jgi:hypothetical protein